MFQKVRIYFVIPIILLIMCTSCRISTDKKELKLAHSLPLDHPVHLAMEFMASRTAELSKGKLTIKVYPSGQLGSEQQCLELVQLGSLSITKVSAGTLESFCDEFKIFGLPYIFRSKEHSNKVLNGEIGKELLLKLQEKWIYGLCFYDAGSRSFYSKNNPIRKPADLDGMKIRVIKSNAAVETIRVLGGAATPISWGELYTALQSGVVDGAENNPPSLFSSRHYEVCKYYSLNEHTTIPDVLVIGGKIWEKFSREEKEWIRQAADESALFQQKLWEDEEKLSLEAMRKAGVQILYPDKKLFIKKVQPLLESYQTRPIIYNYIKRIQAVH